MGFLIGTTPGVALRWGTLPALLALCGCQPQLLFLPSTQSQAGEWLQESGSPEGSSFRSDGPEPPLRLRWRQQIDSPPLGGALLSGELMLQLTKNAALAVLDRHRGLPLARKGFGHDVCGPAAVAGASSRLLLVGELGRKPVLRAIDRPSGETLWSQPGRFCSAPVVRGDTLLIVSENGPLLALSLSDGGELWSREPEARWVTPPSLADSLAYICDSGGGLAALRLADGSERWTRSLGSGFCGRPAVSGGKVFAASATGDIFALAAASGGLLWKAELASLPAPGLVAGEGMVVAGCSDRRLYGIDAETGKIAWRFETGAAIRSTPAASGPILYAAGNDQFLYALRLDSGHLKWKFRLDGPVSQPVVVVRDGVALATDSGTAYLFGR